MVKDNIKGSGHLCKKHVGIPTPSLPESVIDDEVSSDYEGEMINLLLHIRNNPKTFPKTLVLADMMLEDAKRLFLHVRIKVCLDVLFILILSVSGGMKHESTTKRSNASSFTHEL